MIPWKIVIRVIKNSQYAILNFPLGDKMKDIWKLVALTLLISFFILPVNGMNPLFSKEGVSSSINTDNAIFCADANTEYWAVIIVAFNETPAIYPHLYDALLSTNTWDASHIKLLYRENATRQAILQSLDWLRENADSDDIILFADNSHGTVEGGYLRGDYGIVPWDGNETGIITVQELDAKFDDITAKGICLVFDCCLAGNFVDKKTMDGGQIESSKLFRNRFKSGIEGENRVVLMATVKYGLGFHAKVMHENTTIDISLFQNFWQMP